MWRVRIQGNWKGKCLSWTVKVGWFQVVTCGDSNLEKNFGLDFLGLTMFLYSL